MKILSASDADIQLAAQALRDGLLVAIPTETVYGLGANARLETALARVFAAKERPAFDPLIIHVATAAAASEVADMSVPWAQMVAAAFWPGPLTLVLPKRDWVPDLATSGLPTVAVRCPGLELTRRLIAAAGVPVAAPSANAFGHLSPTTAAHVAAGLGERVDYIVDGGACSLGVESTVLDLSMDPPLVLRPGGLSFEAIRELVPTVQLFDRSTTSPRAPGQLPNHYAPAKPLFLFPSGALPVAASGVPVPGSGWSGLPAGEGCSRLAALCFGSAAAERLRSSGLYLTVCDLSPDADVVEAAARLFSALHDLEKLDCSCILAERLPDSGLGRAVNDRLFKASVKPGAAAVSSETGHD